MMVIDISEVKRLLVRAVDTREWCNKRGRFSTVISKQDGRTSNISYYFDETAVFRSERGYILDLGDGKYRILQDPYVTEIMQYRIGHIIVTDVELLGLVDVVKKVKPIKDVRYLSLADRQLITGNIM